MLEHLKGFGCRLLAFDLYPSKEVAEYAEYVDLDTLYKESDIISLHMPSTAENFHMINADTIAKMKDGVIIINTARGNLIDSEALIKGLESEKSGQRVWMLLKMSPTFIITIWWASPCTTRNWRCCVPSPMSS